MKTFHAIILGSLILIGCGNIPEDDDFILKGEYLGQNPPGDKVTLFAEDIVSTRNNERDMTISPDGTEIYFTVSGPSKHTIVYTKRVAESWSPIKTAPFSGNYSDLEASFSPDGSRIYFASNRPLDSTGEIKDFDIWYVEREGRGWSEPVNIGPAINTESNQYYPSVASNGNLYYTSTDPKSIGLEDIFISRPVDGQYADYENIGTMINSDKYEFNAFIAPDESYIVFTSYGRDDGLGGGDLYISRKDKNGQWQKAVNLGEKINSPDGLDYCPFVTRDNKYFFFTSNRKSQAEYSVKPESYRTIVGYMERPGNGWDDIYWINLSEVENLR